MTEYCSVCVTELWEPDVNPNIVVEYVFGDGNCDSPATHSIKPHARDHLSSQSSLPERLQVRRQHVNDEPDQGDSLHCQFTLQCKLQYDVSIVGVWVVSEARTVEVYDGKDGSYLQTARGRKDKEDSEADDSRVHFLCQCQLEQPLGAVTVKFLGLGQRVNFEIAHIRVMLQPGSVQTGMLPGQTINMDKLRQDVNDMGDSVSDRAKAFLTTLENFQKNKHGGMEDMRHLLLDKNAPEGMGQSMAGITTLLSMFASSTGRGANSTPSGRPQDTMSSSEGSMMNHMLTQMMGSMAVGEGEGTEGDQGDMFRFLQSVCGQVSQQRAEEKARVDPGLSAEQAGEQAAEKGSGDATESSAELESRVTAQVEAMMETRLSAVEDHIKQQVDQRMEELEERMTGKLDAIFALLQAQKQS